MKKIILIVLCIIGFVLGFIAGFTDTKSKKLELVLETNGGVPYVWKYEIENKNIVKYVKSYEKENKNKNGMVGAPIKTAYVFKGLKKGTTKIIFKYTSIVDKSVVKKEVYTVKVDKNKKISLVD